jgi:predicted transcriptional regulator
MTIAEIAEILDASLVCGEERMDEEIEAACGSDLMSDVLAFVEGATVLLTGMTNAHVVKTCEMVDIHCIVFVRGKRPTDELVALCEEGGIAVLCSPHTLYASCGMLYSKGLRGHAKERMKDAK